MVRPDEAYKRATIEQWTADPCGDATGTPGTAAYFEALDRARDEYAPWMHEALDYSGAAGLDVLDVGCGQGIDVVRYARARARVAGLDLTPRHVALAHAHLDAFGLTGTVVEGDAERLPFDDASFDRVSSNGVLHHTPDIAAALREIARVLRPGGRATVVLYNRSSLHYWTTQVLYEGIYRRRLLEERSMANLLSANVERSSIGARPLVRVYSPRQARRLLAEAGLVDVGTEVRHFHPEDSWPTAVLAPRVRSVRDPRLTDWLARHAGWYVVARGVA